MRTYFLFLGLLLTGCVHDKFQDQDMEYRLKILEKRIRILELDMQFILDYENEPTIQKESYNDEHPT